MRIPRARAPLVRRRPGVMNKTEERYAEHLALAQRGGEIADFWFESVKLKLADLTFYTPDFFVQKTDGTLEMHEVKGFWEDDARVKIKVAASMFPFRFIGVQERAKKNGGGWEYEEF